jgi:hypothetical protein
MNTTTTARRTTSRTHSEVMAEITELVATYTEAVADGGCLGDMMNWLDTHDYDYKYARSTKDEVESNNRIRYAFKELIATKLEALHSEAAKAARWDIFERDN